MDVRETCYVRDRSGLPKINFQILRPTVATLAHKKGDVEDLLAVIGHSFHSRTRTSARSQSLWDCQYSRNAWT
jgi:hypothetical protein